jgi:hypothetical protein
VWNNQTIPSYQIYVPCFCCCFEYVNEKKRGEKKEIRHDEYK